jgi:hypothetical protein
LWIGGCGGQKNAYARRAVGSRMTGEQDCRGSSRNNEFPPPHSRPLGLKTHFIGLIRTPEKGAYSSNRE